MATTTFNGPVRSEKGFVQVNKNTSTGAYTARTLGLKPDLTSLTATVVATSTPLTYAANVITVNNYSGGAAQAVTLPAATVGTVVVHAQSDDSGGGTAILTFTCAGSDVYRTGSKMESRATGAVQTIDTSAASETILTYTPASPATNSLTHGCYLYFTCYEKGTWDFAYDLSTANDADTGAAAWS
jgi:hypothetical protein